MVSRMPAIVTVDENNNCKIVIDNCAPYNITLKRNDIIGLMDIKTDELIPIEDSVISSILGDIDKQLPKVLKKKNHKRQNCFKCSFKCVQ